MTTMTTVTRRTPDQIAVDVAAMRQIGVWSGFNAKTRRIIRAAAAEAVRRARAEMLDAEKFERFGRAVYSIMDGEEWSSDTLQSIGDYASLVLGMPFAAPKEDES